MPSTKVPLAKSAKGALALAQRYLAQRTARRELAKQVEAMEEDEAALKKALMDSMVGLEITTIGDLEMDYTLKEEDEPSVTDWEKLWAHIQKTGYFDLLTRRVNPAAVKERWKAGKKVPGVDKYPVQSLSVTKSKGAK